MLDSPNPNSRPPLGEIARDLHGMAGIGAISKSYTDTLLENPDSILLARGRDLAIYDEMLRDDQVKATFQQRRSAVTQCDWQVDPASDAAKALCRIAHRTPRSTGPILRAEMAWRSTKCRRSSAIWSATW